MVPLVTGKKSAHNLPEAKRRDPLCKKEKEEVVASGEENLMEKDEEFQTIALLRSTNDGSKTHSSHMKVASGYAVWDCGAVNSLCGAKPNAQMALSSSMKLRVPGSIDGKEVSFAPKHHSR